MEQKRPRSCLWFLGVVVVVVKCNVQRHSHSFSRGLSPGYFCLVISATHALFSSVYSFEDSPQVLTVRQ